MSIGPGFTLPVAVMQPVPPFLRLSSRNTSEPANTSKLLLANASSMALVFDQSPEESLAPATMPGYFDSSRSMRLSVMGTFDTGGM